MLLLLFAFLKKNSSGLEKIKKRSFRRGRREKQCEKQPSPGQGVNVSTTCRRHLTVFVGQVHVVLIRAECFFVNLALGPRVARLLANACKMEKNLKE
jgi:hypothetical protein